MKKIFITTLCLSLIFILGLTMFEKSYAASTTDQEVSLQQTPIYNTDNVKPVDITDNVKTTDNTVTKTVCPYNHENCNSTHQNENCQYNHENCDGNCQNRQNSHSSNTKKHSNRHSSSNGQHHRNTN